MNRIFTVFSANHKDEAIKQPTCRLGGLFVRDEIEARENTTQIFLVHVIHLAIQILLAFRASSGGSIGTVFRRRNKSQWPTPGPPTAPSVRPRRRDFLLWR